MGYESRVFDVRRREVKTNRMADNGVDLKIKAKKWKENKMTALDFDKTTEEAMRKLETKAIKVLTDVLDGQYDGAYDR